MIEWIKFSKYNLPPQGLKILCFRKGDLWVARRINYQEKDYWIEIPYGGNDGCILTDEPEYWMKLDLPERCTGFIKIQLEYGKLMTLDELQACNPEYHEEFVFHMFIEHANKINN